MSFSPDKPASEPTSYEAALSSIHQHAAAHRIDKQGQKFMLALNGTLNVADPVNVAACEDVTLCDAVGLKSAETIYASKSTPEYATAAMDGYAVCSSRTTDASQLKPVTFHVVDSIAAGDFFKYCQSDRCRSQEDLCVEIMTGARLPDLAHSTLDAVVKVEDAVALEQHTKSGAFIDRYIQVIRPVEPLQHRRPAGSDITKGDEILKVNTTVEPKHIATLASLGVSRIKVQRGHKQDVRGLEQPQGCLKVKIGVLSTGSEIIENQFEKATSEAAHSIFDSNGPYLISNLRKRYPDANIEYLGVTADDEEVLMQCLDEAITGSKFDIIISSGGVSKGRYDLVKHVVRNRLQGGVVFHGVAIRPGAPILFGIFRTRETDRSAYRRTAFFGAPGNPLATAVALQFFIIPYLERLNSNQNCCSPDRDFQLTRRVSFPSTKPAADREAPSKVRRKPKGTTSFWLAKQQPGGEIVEILDDQASYKLRGLLQADCWVIVPAGQSEVACGEMLAFSPF